MTRDTGQIPAGQALCHGHGQWPDERASDSRERERQSKDQRDGQWPRRPARAPKIAMVPNQTTKIILR